MVWLIVATVCAFFVKGLCGFANTLVFTSILSFGMNNVNISPVELMLGYPSNVIMVWRERRSVKWRLCLPLAAVMIGGCIPGVLLLKNADVSMVKIFFGVLIIVLGVLMLRPDQGEKREQSKFATMMIGVLSGVLCGIYGVGALAGIYLTRVTKDSHEFKANISVVFFLEDTFRILIYVVTGIITVSSFVKALSLFPVMFIGLGLGIACSDKLDEKAAKKTVVIMLIISGFALIISSL